MVRLGIMTAVNTAMMIVKPNRHKTNDQPNTPANAALVLINTIGLMTGAAMAKATPKLIGAPRYTKLRAAGITPTIEACAAYRLGCDEAYKAANGAKIVRDATTVWQPAKR